MSGPLTFLKSCASSLNRTSKEHANYYLQFIEGVAQTMGKGP
jgi:hypothetical protein